VPSRMCNKEEEYLRRLFDEADDAVSLLSNMRKPERERRVCAAFLRCAGINFNPTDLRSISNDPPDVSFQAAAFEVKFIYGGRKVHKEWKDRASRYQNAKTIDDVLDRVSNPEPLSLPEVVDLVREELQKQSYDPQTRARLDALVYVNLKERFLGLPIRTPDTAQLGLQGWRSVSVLFPPYACVLVASESAPAFLVEAVGIVRSDSQNPDQWFEI